MLPTVSTERRDRVLADKSAADEDTAGTPHERAVAEVHDAVLHKVVGDKLAVVVASATARFRPAIVMLVPPHAGAL